MDIKVNFSGRAIRYTEDEIAVVVEAMRSAEPLTQGKYLQGFQKAFGEYIGAEHCFAVMNGVSALELSAQLCNFKPGDEVIIPSHTFTASAYPYAKKGAKLVWADVDPTTHVVNAETIEKCITPKTKAIVVVHLYGYVADMPAIMDVAKKHNLLVIEDAAQSVGADVNGVKSGAWGDMAIFSFHSHKNLTTLGEGGMLVVKDPKLAALVPMLRHNGHCGYPEPRPNYWTPAMGNVDMPMLDGDMLWPNNYCLGEVECALGIKMLERIDQINAEKRARAMRFIDGLKDFPELEFLREDTTRHNYHLLVACMKNGKRDAFMHAISEEKGIKCVVQYIPLDRYDFYKKLGLGKADELVRLLPNVEPEKIAAVVKAYGKDGLVGMVNELGDAYHKMSGEEQANAILLVDATQRRIAVSKQLAEWQKKQREATKDHSSTARYIENIRAEISRLNGEMAHSWQQKLDIKLGDITKKGKDAHLSLDQLRALTKEYASAADAKRVRDLADAFADLDLKIVQAAGDTRKVKGLEIAKQVEEERRKLEALAKTPEEKGAISDKLTTYRASLETEVKVENLQVAADFYEKRFPVITHDPPSIRIRCWRHSRRSMRAPLAPNIRSLWTNGKDSHASSPAATAGTGRGVRFSLSTPRRRTSVRASSRPPRTCSTASAGHSRSRLTVWL